MRNELTAFILVLTLVAPVGLRTADAVMVFSSDFEDGAVPDAISGFGVIAGTQNYAPYGFGSSFLLNDSGRPDVAADATVLTLTNLPEHTAVQLSFYLAVNDTWDGNTDPTWAQDFLEISIDGITIFSETLDNYHGHHDQSFLPGDTLLVGPQNGLWTHPDQVGTGNRDSAYHMGLYDAFQSIPHTGSTLEIRWQAAGEGWQGFWDESFALDNIEITIVPEPCTLLLLATGGIFLFRKRL